MQQLSKLIALSLVLLSAFLSGCDNTLNVTAEWKEIPVVYGLLNPYANQNFLRINRAYLNESGDALSFAGQADSIQFEDLTVTLVEFQNGVEQNSIIMEKVLGDTIGLPKEPGIFAETPNILYRTSYKIKPTDFRNFYHYDLIIVNNVSGKVYKSSANVVGLSEIRSPIRAQDPKFNIDDDTNRFIYIDYKEAPQAKMYDCVIRFRYKEYNKNTPNDYTIDSVSWVVFSGKETIKIRGYEDRTFSTKSHNFYDLLNASIAHDPDMERVPLDMGFYLLAGGEDLYTYIQVNKPSIGIVQKKPEFTNIENGIGIFSSLSIMAFDHVVIDAPMMRRLTISSRVSELNFVTP